MTPLRLLQNCRSDWLIGHAQLVALTQARLTELSQFKSPPVICLAEADPIAFLAGLIAACEQNCPLFLCNPNWAISEWQQVFELARPDLVWGKSPAVPQPLHPATAQPSWIMIPTGGSSGQIRFAVHTWQALMAAVEGFQAYFQVEQINSCCVLPLYHVSGLMQALRSLSTGGNLSVLSLQQLNRAEPACFLSLVPTQLQRLIPAAAWLSQFQAVFLGGAPTWPELLTQARQLSIPLAPTYGMTETAAQIATLKPADFLQGQTGCGQVLPHASIEITRSNSAGIGTLTIRSKSLMLGYFPDIESSGEFQTDDLGYFDRQGSLHIVGRNSQKIITGGENVFPTEVEAAIRATGLVADVAVVGMPDQTWGEAVVAICVMGAGRSPAMLKTALAPHLTAYKLPKRWVFVDQIPRSAQGKVNLTALRQFASGQTHIPPRPLKRSADA